MMHSPTTKPVRLSHFWQAVLMFAPLVFLFWAFKWLSPGEALWRGVIQLVFCLWFTILLFIGIIVLLRATYYKKGILNFLVGDDGGYSLSRLQAATWAVVIMASQFCQIFSLLNNEHNLFRYYEPTFSDSAMWLLGLSLTSYVAVKTVTVNNMRQSQNSVTAFKTKAQWSDIISGPNGLDLSKCQMLIWTLLAICVFESKVYLFDNAVIHASAAEYVKLALRMYDENQIQKGTGFEHVIYVPFLPWSFVVLMGLSQGVYVGKKLVPQFKLDDLKAARQTQLEDTTAQLTLKKQYLSNILDNPNYDPNSAVDKISATALNKQITDLQQQIAEINGDINAINNYTKAN